MPGLIRVILIAILFGILFSFYRKFKKKLLVHKNNQENNQKSNNPQQDTNSPTKMLQCEQCGVFVPETDAIKEGEHVYCSLEHKDNK